MASQSYLPGPTPPFTAIYDQEYFSGSQVSIYIGDIWVDEITSFSYGIQHDKRPLYGYASEVFDDIANGQIIVQGQFTINYKEQGYLWAVLQRYKNVQGAANLRSPISQEAFELDTRAPSARGISKAHQVSHRTIEQFPTMKEMLSGGLTKDKTYEQYLSIAGYATSDVGSPRDKAFEDLMEGFENQVWGEHPEGLGFDNTVRNPTGRAYNDFDIYVVFGNYTNDASNHTAQKIQGVRLTSQGKQIMVGGAPIQEEYSFIARNVM